MKKHPTTVLVLTLLTLIAGCQSESEQKQAASDAARKPASGVVDVAKKVTEGVGTVQRTFTEGTRGPVYVFEEFHTSRVGQLEIAIMLLRLRDQFGVKKIGLEGAFQSPRPLSATWFHNAGGAGAKGAREDVAVRMLAEGEISSSEFLTLLFPDEEVYGIELADLYNRDSDIQGGAAIGYLVSIAETNAQQNLSQTDIQKLNGLMKQGKQEDAMELLINSDPWTREQYGAIKRSSADNAGSTSCEAMEKEIRAMQAKADEVGAKIDAQVKKIAGQTIDFYETCQKRSLAMVSRTVDLPGAKPETPVAMIIGAAHTEGVTQLLRERKVSFAVITPTGLNPHSGSLTTEQFDRKNKIKWARTGPGTLGRLLNAPGATVSTQGERKPPPIIETTTAESYASAELAGMLIAAAARDRKRIPDDIWDQIKDLPEFSADRGSFTLDGDDVIYKTTLKKTDGRSVVVWARVGTANTPEAARSVEQKLLQARADLGGSGRIPPTGPPSNSAAANDEGPGDGRRGHVVISRTGLRSLAVFGTSRADVVNVGRVSG